jgi:hypothetical protein
VGRCQYNYKHLIPDYKSDLSTETQGIPTQRPMSMRVPHRNRLSSGRTVSRSELHSNSDTFPDWVPVFDVDAPISKSCRTVRDTRTCVGYVAAEGSYGQLLIMRITREDRDRRVCRLHSCVSQNRAVPPHSRSGKRPSRENDNHAALN